MSGSIFFCDRQGIPNVPGTGGYDPKHNFGHGRQGPANPVMVPDLPAFAAHTACDPGEADRQRSRRIRGARKRLFGRGRPPTTHICPVFPSRPSPSPAAPRPTPPEYFKTNPENLDAQPAMRIP